MTTPESPPPDEVQKLEGWTKDEKLSLLYALKTCGSKNIDWIHQNISTKTPEEIIHAIDYYKNLALLEVKPLDKKIKTNTRPCKNPRIPLACWAKLLTDTLHYKSLQTETSTAIRMIADLENIPPALNTDKFDFRKIYLQIANAMDGKPIPDDKYSGLILKKCILETALISKAFIRTSSLKNLCKTITVTQKEMNYYPMFVHNKELATVRHLASQRSYNPLNIPEEFLKPSLCIKSKEEENQLL
ncbi:uncharacterized protein LOC114244757 [Bombyx mandarina]|uniref:Uncharacterized protein LOC114244757 n=1 Tax=Bombyx mandarina TaxID=7092 RepID=A0A6J2JSB3_BOMMA|nr:uncharacterized protein LOC114244757 [Bombyx mandarina]